MVMVRAGWNIPISILCPAHHENPPERKIIYDVDVLVGRECSHNDMEGKTRLSYFVHLFKFVGENVQLFRGTSEPGKIQRRNRDEKGENHISEDGHRKRYCFNFELFIRSRTVSGVHMDIAEAICKVGKRPVLRWWLDLVIQIIYIGFKGH